MHVVLITPEIPQNTGNIARTCAATGAILHLVRPLGFSLADRYLKRAGLDYWELAEILVHDSFDEVIKAYPESAFRYATVKANRSYADINYGRDDILVFGCESRGLSETLIESVYDRCIRIPMRTEARSLNLSNSVAVILFEALRQQSFPGLAKAGHISGCGIHSQGWIDYV